MYKRKLIQVNSENKMLVFIDKDLGRMRIFLPSLEDVINKNDRKCRCPKCSKHF